MGGKKFLGALVVGILASTSLLAAEPTEIKVGLGKAYIPVGFDDNDRAQVMVAGQFPSACYKIGPSRIEVDAANKTVYVDQRAYFYSGICLQIVVPFTQVVDLGILNEGNYTVKDAVTGTEIGKLPVARSKTDAPDDYMYAPVTDAFVRVEDGKHMLTLNGNFTDRCMKLKDVVVGYYDDVIVVQPIAEMLGSNDCGHQKIRFHHEMPLKDGLDGVQLLHVRVMDGQAINRLVEFP